MKKLTMAVAIVCAAVYSHAALVNWDTYSGEVYQYAADGSSTYATGYVGYFFDAATITDLSDFSAELAKGGAAQSAALASGFVGAKSVDGIIEQTAGIDVASLSGMAGKDGIGYLVIFDAETAASAKHFYIAGPDTETMTAVTGGITGFYFDASETSAGDSAWTAVNNVPEPTSGLLLLLGVAGLALRRRRA